MLKRVAPGSSIATIIFDLDGTIADTAGDLIDAANAALVTEGFGAASAEAIKKGVGYGTKAMLQSALSDLNQEATTEQMRRMGAKLVAHYEQNIALKTTLFPGFAEAALTLRHAGMKIALCTNKREHLAMRLLSELQITGLFDAIAGGDTFPFHKPDPRHVSELIRIAGGEAGSAFMVGDSEADVAAARGAGIPIIVTAFGYASVAAHDLGADAVLAHFSELPALTGNFLGTEIWS
jgi:phosphoglycolate phosphatase